MKRRGGKSHTQTRTAMTGMHDFRWLYLHVCVCVSDHLPAEMWSSSSGRRTLFRFYRIPLKQRPDWSVRRPDCCGGGAVGDEHIRTDRQRHLSDS